MTNKQLGQVYGIEDKSLKLKCISTHLNEMSESKIKIIQFVIRSKE
jgi:hypothetical protein